MTSVQEKVDSSSEGHDTTATVEDNVEVSRRVAIERRRRILEHLGDRMHVVIGGQPAASQESNSIEDDSEETLVKHMDETNHNGEAEQLLKEQQQEEIADSKGNAPNRLQQMRRRRFLNKQRDAELISSDEKEKAVDVSPSTASESAVEVNALPLTEPKVEEEPQKIVREPSDEGPKYVGVAKMRRKLVAEQRQQQQSSEEKNVIEDENVAVLVPNALRHLPILLELLTILMLCVAGMGMGWHTWINNSGCFQSGFHAGEKVNLKNIPFYFTKRNVTTPSRDLVTFSFGEQDTFIPTTGGDEEDEFAEVLQPKKKPVRTEDEAAVDGDEDDEDFHFDYDKIYAKRMQQGGNPFDVFAWLISKIFSTITYSMSVIFFMKWFKSCPPTFLIMAALGRQVGRMLGGAYPQEIDESEEGSNGFDVFKVAKKFISGSFPTLAKAYRFYSEARTDMYIVLFGWFLGLVLAHFWSFASAPPSISQGEL